MTPETSVRRPLRLLLVQTQAEAAGAQEISRVLGDELTLPRRGGEPEFEVHHLFLYRKTNGCDDFPNVHFVADPRPSGPISAIKFVVNLFSLIRDIRPDVLLTFQHYGNIVGAPAGRLLGISHVIANQVSPQAVIRRPVSWIDRMLGLTGCYDAITVNSLATLADYADYPERYRRLITHVPHGFADKTISISKEQARASFGLPMGVKLLGSVARLNTIKRLDLSIRTLQHLPDVELALLGQGPAEADLRSLAEQLGVADRVHFLGEVSPLEVGRFLAALDVFVFPTQTETFGLAAVEAAQAGVPVIATDLPVMREVLQVDGEPCGLFLDPTDTTAFAAEVRRVLDHPDLRQRLSNAGRELRRLHSPEAMADGYRRLIAAVRQKGRRTTSRSDLQGEQV